KKAIIGIAAGLFAVATVFNMNMLNDKSGSDVSLDAVAAMAEAQSESGGGQAALCNPIWIVTYKGSVGTDTSAKVECTTGGAYICPLCFWKS
ncbi:MAG: hypothetical protein ACQESQ_12250, partial [Bacteroidota bacterium]